MKRMLLSAAALGLIIAPVAEAKKKKDQATTTSIDAPTGPARAILASWPVGVTPTTPTIAADAILPTNTEIVVKLNSELNSKNVREGQTFVGSVASDVMLGNVIVIPRGTPVNGVVTYRTGKGAFGKSAKMDYELRSMDIAGQRIGISGKYRQEGRGNTGAAVGAGVAVGVFGAFVTGRSAIVPQGTELKAYTTAVIPVSPPAGEMAAVQPAPLAVAQPTLTPAVATTPVK